MQRSIRMLARVYASHTDYDWRIRATNDASYMPQAKKREGHLEIPSVTRNTTAVRRTLHAFASDPSETARLTDLPGVEFESELPADPLTRIFFQRKGTHALYQGTYEAPSPAIDRDRVQIKARHTPMKHRHLAIKSAVYDFCHRVREASDQRKRIVVVPATAETKGAAELLLKRGLIAGLRDFHNERAFAIELKYFQTEPVISEIIPASADLASECEWSPSLIREYAGSRSRAGGIRVYVLRTWDGRIIDHQTACAEGIGGRGLLMAW